MNKPLDILIQHGWVNAEGALPFSMSLEVIVSAALGPLLRPIMIGGLRHVL
jgi:hypothetical protein